MAKAWQILVVDDEKDVHEVSRLALRRKQWKGRAFALVSAYSGADARRILSEASSPRFHVAIVDVVMETERAGLDLCDFIREQMPLSLRIVLRTGQPGMAPEEAVLNNYDIDQYLAKSEVTEERLYSVLRTACRSSLDIASSLALETQLRESTRLLQLASTSAEDLMQVVQRSVEFIEEKYGVRVAFIDDLARASKAATEAAGARSLDVGQLASALAALHESGAAGLLPQGAPLAKGTFLMPIRALEAPSGARGNPPAEKWSQRVVHSLRTLVGVEANLAAPRPVRAGFCVVTGDRDFGGRELKQLARDLLLVAENWRIAIAVLGLRETTVQARMMEVDAKSRHSDIV